MKNTHKQSLKITNGKESVRIFSLYICFICDVYILRICNFRKKIKPKCYGKSQSVLNIFAK
jgi:hypothetical protein